MQVGSPISGRRRPSLLLTHRDWTVLFGSVVRISEDPVNVEALSMSCSLTNGVSKETDIHVHVL
jgi:hypothetical protein